MLVMHRYIDDVSVSAIRKRIQHGADVNARDESGDTPLHNLILASPPPGTIDTDAPLRVAIATLLLDAGADMGRRNADGLTPLELARQRQLPELVRVLETRERVLDRRQVVQESLNTTTPAVIPGL